MQDIDQTIVTPGKTLKFEKIELRPHLIILYPQTQFKQIALEKGTVTLGRGQDADIRLDDELVIGDFTYRVINISLAEVQIDKDYGVLVLNAKRVAGGSVNGDE